MIEVAKLLEVSLNGTAIVDAQRHPALVNPDDGRKLAVGELERRRGCTEQNAFASSEASPFGAVNFTPANRFGE